MCSTTLFHFFNAAVQLLLKYHLVFVFILRSALLYFALLCFVATMNAHFISFLVLIWSRGHGAYRHKYNCEPTMDISTTFQSNIADSGSYTRSMAKM